MGFYMAETFLLSYAVFCITTALCIMWLQVKAVYASSMKFTFSGWITFLTMTFFVTLIMAPIYFIIFIWGSEEYYTNLLKTLRKEND